MGAIGMQPTTISSRFYQKTISGYFKMYNLEVVMYESTFFLQHQNFGIPVYEGVGTVLKLLLYYLFYCIYTDFTGKPLVRLIHVC